MNVFSTDNFTMSIDDLVSIFNASMELQYKEFANDLEDYIKNPYDLNYNPDGNYCPSTAFQNWLNVTKSLVSETVENELKTKIEEAGWTINKFTWQKDERTGDDKLYIYIKK